MGGLGFLEDDGFGGEVEKIHEMFIHRKKDESIIEFGNEIISFDK